VGQDIPQSSAITNLPNAYSNVIKADRLRRVEIRFGDNGKAYRYVNGMVGTSLVARNNSWRYAAGITASDTIGKGAFGKFGEGFVDVPFKAYVVDEKYGEEYPLAVGFIERSGSGNTFLGKPDGIWDPDTSIGRTREAIIIFDAPYDPDGGQVEYTGGVFSTGDTIWADLRTGFTIPDGAQGITERQKQIAKSPWFNALYVVTLQRENLEKFFTSGDVFEIRMGTYPYTNGDEFTFTTLLGGALSENDKKALFDKVNVFPNPLFGFNPATSFDRNESPDVPYITFSNLPPEDVTVKIYTLSGILIRTLTRDNTGTSPTSPFLRWDLKNEDGLRAASGLYLSIVTVRGYGEKILKFSIIMPQKQIQQY
jgi:hypothetical protein